MAVKERFPDVWTPGRSDLCFATTNRQIGVDGTRPPMRRDRGDRFGQLVEHAERSNNSPAKKGANASFGSTPSTNCPTDLAGIVGVTAGASAPEELVEAVVEFLAPINGIEFVNVTDEDEYFPPPRNIRDLQNLDRDGLDRPARGHAARPARHGRPQPRRQ